MACHRVQPVCGWNGSLAVFWMIQSCYPLKCKWTPCFSSDLNTEIQKENVWGKKEVLSPLLRVHGNFMIISFVQWLCRSIITSHWLGSTAARKSITQHHTVAVSYYSWGAESSLRSLTLPQTPPSPHTTDQTALHTPPKAPRGRSLFMGTSRSHAPFRLIPVLTWPVWSQPWARCSPPHAFGIKKKARVHFTYTADGQSNRRTRLIFPEIPSLPSLFRMLRVAHYV